MPYLLSKIRSVWSGLLKKMALAWLATVFIAVYCLGMFFSSPAYAQGEIVVGRNGGVNWRWAVHSYNLAEVFEQIHAGGEEWGIARSTTALATGDIDGDGLDEVALGRDAGTNMRWAVYDDAATLFRQIQEGGTGWAITRGTTALAMGDIDGDGRAELALGRDGGSNMRWAIYRYDNASQQMEQIQEGGTGWAITRGTTALAMGDIDGDGRAELALGRDAGSNMRWAIYRYDNTSQQMEQIQEEGTSWGITRRTTALAMGDIDEDGRAELALGRNGSANPNSMHWSVYQDDSDTEQIDLEQILSGGESWGATRRTTALAIGITGAKDSDGDGLLDLWEINGVDFDGDGSIDVDLPMMGANPLHKDIFVELDWVTGQAPTRAAIQALKAAFSEAPTNSGGIPNPDGQPGINLWIDTGTLSDAVGLVGDDFGGGNAVSGPVGCLDSNFYNTKQNNFVPNRAWVFHYSISGDPADSDACGGGRGELGGNDFIEYNHDPGTIMHELGHNLNLRHGGFENINCKPNYVSVMNYDRQFEINQDTDGDRVIDNKIIDYSPPRFTGGRGNPALPQLVEDNLSEVTILDSSDPENWFVFTDVNGRKVNRPLNQRVDWNSDGDTNDTDIAPVNINTLGVDKQPQACENNSSDQTLNGYDDWTNVALNFRQFGNADDAPINPVTEPEPKLEDLLILQEELNTTDLEITKSAFTDLDVAVAGQELVYALAVRNNGPNPAKDVQVVDFLPAQVTHISNTGNCVEAPAGRLNCSLGGIPAYETKEFEIRVHIAADLPCLENQLSTITNSAQVENLAGSDLDTTNNRVAESTQVLCSKYEYSAKLICGKQGNPADLRLAHGLYATAINIHNPNDEKIYFFKKLALTYPPEEQKPGRVIPIAVDTLEYDEALAVDCLDIQKEAFDGEFPESYVKGFVVIQSPKSLDVTAVYTTASLDRQGRATEHSSIDVEQIRERVRELPEKVELPDLIPLAPLPPPPFNEEFGGQLPEGIPGALFCAINSPPGGPSQSITVTVRNQGLATAGASMTVADFFLIGEQVQMETSSLEPGDEVTLNFEIPQGCYNFGSCSFRLKVDAGNQEGVVTESNENNNVVESLCLAPPG